MTTPDPEDVPSIARIYDYLLGGAHNVVEGAGFRVDADGLVDISRWAPGGHDGRPLAAYALITEQLSSPTAPPPS